MRKALTIGELLVTMAIIGVIAMLVLPSFIKDYHNKLYTTKLKKSYEMISSAIEQACNDNNVSYFSQTPYASSDRTKQAEFINKYFKVSKNASTTSTDIFSPKYRILNTGEENDLSDTALEDTAAKAKLKGGEAIAIACSDVNKLCYVTLDINSTDEPNIGGRDMFRFSILPTTNEVVSLERIDTCGEDPGGHGCLKRIIRDNWVMEY